MEFNFEDSEPDPICHFPKHNGVPWILVVEDDPDYVEFLLSDDYEGVLGEDLYSMLMMLMEER